MESARQARGADAEGVREGAQGQRWQGATAGQVCAEEGAKRLQPVGDDVAAVQRSPSRHHRIDVAPGRVAARRRSDGQAAGVDVVLGEGRRRQEVRPLAEGRGDPGDRQAGGRDDAQSDIGVGQGESSGRDCGAAVRSRDPRGEGEAECAEVDRAVAARRSWRAGTGRAGAAADEGARVDRAPDHSGGSRKRPGEAADRRRPRDPDRPAARHECVCLAGLVQEGGGGLRGGEEAVGAGHAEQQGGLQQGELLLRHPADRQRHRVRDRLFRLDDRGQGRSAVA